jgi:hypothetical protein
MVNWYAGVPPAGVNSAPHVRAPFNASRCAGVPPLQSPVHAVNVYPALGVASRPIDIAAGIVTAQAVPPAPQAMPAARIIPPVGGVTVSVYGGPVTGPPPVAVNVAVHVLAASTSTLVVRLVPLHAPPQLVNP